MIKEQQCRTFKKDGKLLRDVFCNKQGFHRCPEIPLCLGVFQIACIYIACENIHRRISTGTSQKHAKFPPRQVGHGSDDSVDQSADGVCSLNLLAPFQTSWYPTEEYCQRSAAGHGSVA